VRHAAGGGQHAHLSEGAIYDEAQGGPLYTVRIVCGPGDDAAPVLTFMRPDED